MELRTLPPIPTLPAPARPPAALASSTASSAWLGLAKLRGELGGSGAVGVCDGSGATGLRLWATSV